MRKRSSRVYVLLIIMSFIMAVSMILDITVTKTSDTITETTVNAEKINIEKENNTEIETEETTEETTRVLSSREMEEVNNFYKNTVFVGDSIMLGFSNYSALDEAPEFVKNLTFLAASSYGVNAAITGKGLIYKGESRPLIENLTLINPDKIFINLGVNELDGVAAEKVGAKYDTLIKQIKDALPNTQVYVLGITYFVEGKETSTYNNNGLRAFNEYLSSHADQWGITYLDLGEKLSNEKGYLPSELASDRIHHNTAGHRKWVEFLEDVALEKTERI